MRPITCNNLSPVHYRWSDIWLLLAIVIGNREGATLTEIISTGDLINHALFTDAELEGGFARLTRGGYITESEGLFCPTEKALALYDSASQRSSSLHHLRTIITEELQAESWSAEYDSGQNEDRYPGYSPEKVRKAEKEYRTAMKKFFRQSKKTQTPE